MDVWQIINQITAVPISNNATVTQLQHEEDDSFYQVWKITTDNASYILKESKGREAEIYQSVLSMIKNSVPAVYQTLVFDGKTYLFMEKVEGENLCKCTRGKLVLALDALIALQEQTWGGAGFAMAEEFFRESVLHRQNRGKYLNDAVLENAYEKFLQVYQSTPKALCHDDLLPFNILISAERAVLIDWEVGGILPYPTSFARLIAHTEEDENALFYMSQADKEFAVDYYYEHLLKGKGISYQDWRKTLDCFLFYEYCEWVFVGNKYNATDGEYFKKYLPLAKAQASQLEKY